MYPPRTMHRTKASRMDALKNDNLPKTITWERFVDVITVVWLTLFFWGVADPDTIIPDALDLGLLSVFVVDLVFKLRSQPTWKAAFRNHWFDILLVIPYVRIFKILRFTRALRLLKTVKIAKLGKYPGHQKVVACVKKVQRVAVRVRASATRP